MAPHLIIAIPSYKRPESLRTLLNQLAVQEGAQPFTVYVLNDGAFPASSEMLNSVSVERFELHFFHTPSPSGLPRARNILLDAITDFCKRESRAATLVCFLDDDCEVNTKFVQEVYRAAERYKAFCFRIETVGQSGIVNTMHHWLVRRALQPFMGMVILPLGFIRGGYFQPFKRPQRVDHLPGGCLIYRFDQYPKLRFEEALNDGNAILEDTDFSLALSSAGARLWYVGSYGIVHRPGNAGGVRIDVPREKYWYYWRHKRFLVRKWCGTWALVTAFPLAFLESIALSFMQQKWFVWVMIRAWLSESIAQVGRPGLRIAAPQSGINRHATLGGEVYDAALLHALANAGAAVRVLLPAGRIFQDGGRQYQIHTLPRRRSSFGYYSEMFFGLWKTYRSWPFDVLRVHSPYTMTFPVMLFAFFHPRVKRWAHYHHVEERPWFRFLTWLMIRRWHVVSVSSEATKRELVRRFSADENRIVVAYPGVARTVPHDAAQVLALKHERGLSGRLVLLHVGSLQVRKNVTFLIDLMAQLPKQVVLVVLGDGPERARLIRQAEVVGVRDRVAFLGAVGETEKQLWFQAADLLVLASRKEGFGMAVVEAALFGTPAIVSDRGALGEVVHDGVTGRVCPLDIAAWREAVFTFLAYPETLRIFGTRARAEVEQRFSWQKTAASLIQHLEVRV